MHVWIWIASSLCSPCRLLCFKFKPLDPLDPSLPLNLYRLNCDQALDIVLSVHGLCLSQAFPDLNFSQSFPDRQFRRPSALWLYPRFSEHSESDRNLGIPFRIRSDSECEFLNGISFVLGKNSQALGMAPDCCCAAPPRL